MPEDGIDAVDDDCDGMTKVRRGLVASFDASGVVSKDFSFTPGKVTFSDGMAVFNPGSTVADLAVKDAFTWESGELHVFVKMTGINSASGCATRIEDSGAGVYTHARSSGVNDIVATPSPGETVTMVRVRCSGMGLSRLDWLTIQNGPYEWAPLNDLEVTFDQTKFPGGGRFTMVRSSEDGAFLFTGHDAAGFAWSADVTTGATVPYGIDWVTANGAVGQFEDAGATGVWDAFSVDGSEIYILSGLDVDEQDPATLDDDDDGLCLTTDLGESWSQVSPLLAGYKVYDDCNRVSEVATPDTADTASNTATPPVPLLGAKPVASGNLLLGKDGNLYIASEEATLGDGRGIVKDSADTLCQPYDSLPTAVEDPSGGEYAALPSAMVFLHGGDDLLVGYRVLAGDLSGTTSALYVCPTLPVGYTCSATTVSCAPLDDGDATADEAIDVRDIVPAGDLTGLFFIIDGGRRPAGDPLFPTACTEGESTVYALDAPVAGGYDLWDTDGASATPAWAVDTSGLLTDYYGDTSDYCQIAGPTYTVGGNLLPPEDGGTESELVALAADPDAGFLFAFYPTGVGTGDYGCVRHFRAEIPAVFNPEETLEWAPFQGWVADLGEKQANARERRGATRTGGAWLDGQAPLSVWAGTAVQDAAFVPGVLTEQNLLVSGYNLWVIPSLVSTGGWDDTTGDLDLAPWTLAWQGSREFSGGGARGLATCPDCGMTEGDEPYDRIFGLVSDAGMKVYYEEPTTEPRPPGTRDCHNATLGAGGYDVSLRPWVVDETTTSYEVWALMTNQTNELDTTGVRTLLYSPDAGDTWLWDASTVGSRGNFIGSTGNAARDSLRCMDDYEASGAPLRDYIWNGATISGDSFEMFDSRVGHPTAVLAVGTHVALLTAAEACQKDTHLALGGDPCVDTTGQGLWVVTYDEAYGMNYTKVENFDDVYAPSHNPTLPDCDEQRYFSFDTSAEIRLLADSDPDGTDDGIEDGRLDVVMVSRGHALDGDTDAPDLCGLRRVTFTIGDEANAVWQAIPTWQFDPAYDPAEARGCDLSPFWTRGLEVAADGYTALLFGGHRNGSAGSPGGVCQVVIDPATGDSEATQVIPAEWLAFGVEDLIAHPHVADVYFAVGQRNMGCNDCDPLGLYTIQKRNRPGQLTTWGSKLISGDDLEGRFGAGLTRGTGPDPTGQMTDIYVGANGGTWDGLFSW